MPDPMVHVVAVGDGACTILRPWPERHSGPTAVIDCGVWKAKSIDASSALLTALGGKMENVAEVVVSHFDWDHWGGLRNLRQFPGAHRSMPDATIYYPSMPRPIVVALYALLGPLKGTGSAVLDLQRDMKPLLRPGAALTLEPLHSKSHPITLAGDTFDVIWPPENLGSNIRQGLHNVLKDVEALADALDADGYPELRTNLDLAARATEKASTNDDSAALDAGWDLSSGDHDEVDEDMPDDDEGGSSFDNPMDAVGDLGAPGLLGSLPEKWKDEYRRVLKRARAANNDLSLVIASRTGKLIAFGDIGGGALDEALKSVQERSFDVRLAPHHGTRKLPAAMPSADWCIAQGGKKHISSWTQDHLPTHPGARECFNTHRSGDFFPATQV